MNRAFKKRMRETEMAFWRTPVPQAVAQAAFDQFKLTGELPEDPIVALTVARRVKTGEAPIRSLADVDWGALAASVANPKPPRPEDPYMQALLQEAIWSLGPVRDAARQVLQCLVALGYDVSEPLFEPKEPPEYGSVAMAILGNPDRFATRPYRRQATRLFARMEQLRPQLPHSNREWFHELHDWISRFQEDGERPPDLLMMEAILGLGEVSTLERHYFGEDVRAEMAAFDAVARATGDARETAIEALAEMAREGRFRCVDVHPDGETA